MLRTATVAEALVVQPRLWTSKAVSVAGWPLGSVVNSALYESAGPVSVPFVINQWTLIHPVAGSAGWLNVARLDAPGQLAALVKWIAGGGMERTPTVALALVVQPRLSTSKAVSVAGWPFGSVVNSALYESAGPVSVPLVISQWTLIHPVLGSAGWLNVARLDVPGQLAALVKWIAGGGMERTATVVLALVEQPRLSTRRTVSVVGWPFGSVVNSALYESAGLVSVPLVISQWTLIHPVAGSSGWLNVARLDVPGQLAALVRWIAGGVTVRSGTTTLAVAVQPVLSVTVAVR